MIRYAKFDIDRANHLQAIQKAQKAWQTDKHKSHANTRKKPDNKFYGTNLLSVIIVSQLELRRVGLFCL